MFITRLFQATIGVFVVGSVDSAFHVAVHIFVHTPSPHISHPPLYTYTSATFPHHPHTGLPNSEVAGVFEGPGHLGVAGDEK